MVMNIWDNHLFLPAASTTAHGMGSGLGNQMLPCFEQSPIPWFPGYDHLPASDKDQPRAYHDS